MILDLNLEPLHEVFYHWATLADTHSSTAQLTLLTIMLIIINN